MAEFLLGIDNGGSLSKAALYKTDGTLVSVISQPVPTEAADVGWSERDMDVLWQANLDAIKGVVAESKVDPSQILGITVTGHGNGIYLIDADGKPVRNGIVSNDNRCADIVKEWTETGLYADHFQELVMEQLFTGSPLALLAWMNKNEPEVRTKTHSILMMKDYIRFKLTGKIGLEITDISTTSLLNMRTRKIHFDGFEPLNIGDWQTKFPDLIAPDTVVGGVLEEVAEYTGLKAGTPVYAGIADVAASAIGVGGVEDNQISVITGTWSINDFFSTKPVVARNLFACCLAPFNDRYLILEGSPTSAASLEWLVNSFLKKLPGFAGKSSSEIYSWCNDVVFSGGFDMHDVTYIPYPFGSNLHPGVLAGWMMMSNADGLEQFLYALYEGVAFSHLEHIERLKTYSNEIKPVARLTGGVTNSRRWSQMFANIIGMPLEMVTAPQTGILGAVIAAAVAAGVYPDIYQAAEKMVPIGETIYPEEGIKDDFKQRYAKWKQIISSIEKLKF